MVLKKNDRSSSKFECYRGTGLSSFFAHGSQNYTGYQFHSGELVRKMMQNVGLRWEMHIFRRVADKG